MALSGVMLTLLATSGDRLRVRPDDGLAALVEACGSRPLVEARLPGIAPRHGPPASCQATDLRIRLALARVEERAAGKDDPGAHVAVASAHLLTGSAKTAATRLERALTRWPSNADLSLALSAAYLSMGGQSDDGAWLTVKALDHAERARTLGVMVSERAAANSALALAALGLSEEAERIWRELVNSRDPAFRAEAARRLALLDRARARGDAHRGEAELPAKQRIEEHLLPAWAEAEIAARTDAAAKTLQEIRDAAARMAAAGGDPFFRDVVDGVVRLTPADRAIFAGAQREFSAGRRLRASDDLEGARTRFARAQQSWTQVRSGYALWAELYVAIVEYQRGRIDVRKQLEAIEQRASASGYLVLLARAKAFRGLLAFNRGDLGRAVTLYDEAQQSLARTDDRESIAYVHSLQAEALRTLGESRSAWQHLLAALLISSEFPPAKQETTLISAAQSALQDGLLHASLQFHEAKLDRALAEGTPLSIAEASLDLAAARHRVGDAASARQSVLDAGPWIDKIPNAALRELVEARRTITMLDLEDGERRIPLATGAIAYFQRAGRERRLPSLFLARARTHLQGGRIDAAEQDLRAGIDIIERQRSTVSDAPLRVSFLDESWELYDELIDLQAVRHRRPDLAWTSIEHARATSLLESLGGEAAAPDITLASVSAQIPSDTAVVYYKLSGNALLSWLLTPNGSTFFEQKMDDAELRRRIGDLRERLQDRSPDSLVREDLVWLHDRLIRPLARSASARTLVFVPDGALYDVPFAALIDRDTGKYLIQERAVAVAPSARLFLTWTRGRPAIDERREGAHALVLGNPVGVDRGDLRLAQLPGASREAAEVAAGYGRVSLALGPLATKRYFLERASHADVIHFAGHAIANVDAPQFSRMVFSSVGQEPSLLFAHELKSLNLSKTSLVVLAACSTGRGAVARGEGSLSVARSFLAAGARTVVMTLWDINDDPVGRLFTRFHDEWRKGLAPSEALRQAQLSLISSRDTRASQIATWAGVAILGSK